MVSRKHRVTAYYDEVLALVGALPEARSVAVVSNLPTVGGSDTRDFRAEGHDVGDRTRAYRAGLQVVSQGFFATMEIPLRTGRLFTEGDTADSPSVRIVSDTMARRYWPGEDPMGRRIHLGAELLDDGGWIEIVGVVGDVSRDWIDDVTWPTIYLPQHQVASRTMSLVVRTAGDPLDSAVAVRSPHLEHRRGAAHLPHQQSEEDAARERQRHPHGGGMLFVRLGVRLTLLGVAIGLPMALALMYFLSSVLFGVVAIHPGTIAAFTASLIGVALLASYLPARHASHVDPMVALHYE